jgi:thioredoxin reductase (NADPH)
MAEAVSNIQLIGTRGSADAYAIRDFLHRSDVPFEWIEVSGKEELGDQKRLPVCIFPDGTRMEGPHQLHA